MAMTLVTFFSAPLGVLHSGVTAVVYYCALLLLLLLLWAMAVRFGCAVDIYVL